MCAPLGRLHPHELAVTGWPAHVPRPSGAVLDRLLLLGSKCSAQCYHMTVAHAQKMPMQNLTCEFSIHPLPKTGALRHQTRYAAALGSLTASVQLEPIFSSMQGPYESLWPELSDSYEERSRIYFVAKLCNMAGWCSTVQPACTPQLQFALDAALTFPHNMTNAQSAACTHGGSRRVGLRRAGEWLT